MISICLDVPASYEPKARFAIETMLSAFFVDINYVSKNELKQTGGIYYGTDHTSFEPGDQPLLNLPCDIQTIRFFEKKSLKKSHDIIRIDDSMPVLFGSNESDPPKGVFHSDLIASAFYFLSDWQAYAGSATDKHGRQLYKGTIQYELDSAMRPLVNEYADLLRKWWSDISGKEPWKRKTWNGRTFAAVITHDLDRIKKKYPGTLIREMVDLPLRNPERKPLINRVRRAKRSLYDIVSPADAYEESIRRMFRFEHEKGIKPTVNLKSIIKKDPHDARFYLDYPFMSDIVRKVRQLNGEIGLHGSYQSGRDPQLFHAEKRQLESVLGIKIESHRFHYLRYSFPDSFRILESQRIRTDSSVGWAEQAGYRTGFTHPHNMFDPETNRRLNLVQIPMLMMDMQLFNYMQLSAEEAVSLTQKQVDLAEKYGGVVTWNFHHMIYDQVEAPGCDILFEKSLNYAHSKNPQYYTMGEIHETH